MISRRGALRCLRFLGVTPAWDDLVRTLSEPETGPAADNLVSNEDSYLRVCGELERVAPRGGVYLGVGPEQNFSLLSRTRPELALVVDYRRRNLLVHAVYKALFTLSEDHISFLERLTARHRRAQSDLSAFEDPPMDRRRLDRSIAEVRRVLERFAILSEADWPAIATIQKRLAGPGLKARFVGLPGYPTLGAMIGTTDRNGQPAHVFGRDDLYQTIRQLQIADKILPIVGNLAGKNAAMRRIGDFLRSRGQSIAIIYVSDVEFFLLRNGEFPTYIANIAALPRLPEAVIVRTSTRPIDHPDRVAGDSATTVVRDLGEFLERCREGRVRVPDDLFAL